MIIKFPFFILGIEMFFFVTIGLYLNIPGTLLLLNIKLPSINIPRNINIIQTILDIVCDILFVLSIHTSPNLATLL